MGRGHSSRLIMRTRTRTLASRSRSRRAAPRRDTKFGISNVNFGVRNHNLGFSALGFRPAPANHRSVLSRPVLSRYTPNGMEGLHQGFDYPTWPPDPPVGTGENPVGFCPRDRDGAGAGTSYELPGIRNTLRCTTYTKNPRLLVMLNGC